MLCRVQVGTFCTPLRDGWGITTVGKQMVLSDGSSKLTFVDPAQDFKAVKAVTVRDGTRSIGYLNEVCVDTCGEAWEAAIGTGACGQITLLILCAWQQQH